MSSKVSDIIKKIARNLNENQQESMGDEVIPIVLIVDRSRSMGSGRQAPIDAVNDALASLINDIMAGVKRTGLMGKSKRPIARAWHGDIPKW